MLVRTLKFHYSNLKRSIKWAVFMYKCYTWDFHYVMKALKFYLENIAEDHQNCAFHDHKKDLKNLKQLELDISELLKEEESELQKKFDEKWGSYTCDRAQEFLDKVGCKSFFIRENIKTKKQYARYSQELRKLYEKEEALKQKQYKKFEKSFKKCFDTWWC